MKKSTNLLPANRCFKSQLFVMLFEDKKKLLELYNAVTGKDYQDPEALTIFTIFDVHIGYLLRDYSGRESVWNSPGFSPNSSVCNIL